MSDRLVTVEWVAEHGKDRGVQLIEVDVDAEAYAEGHIENALAWNWTSQLQDQVRRDIPTQEAMQELLGASGIGNDTHVVFYGDSNNWFAAYALWLLDLYGHEKSSLMDGGRVKWLGDDRPTTTAEPAIVPATYQPGTVNVNVRAMRQEVLDSVTAGESQLVDVRSPAEFTGEVIAPPGMSETAQRGGHIPGARNIPWARAVDEDGTFKSADELRALYGGSGITADAHTITYCRIGERSSHTWFVLKHILGFPNVKNYDGSWTEYGSMVDVPIER